MFLTKEERRRLRWHKFLEYLAIMAVEAAFVFLFAAMFAIFN